MVTAELQQLAISLGIKDIENVSSHPMIVRIIQRHRGKEPCFATDKRYLCNKSCEWRADCVKLIAI